MKFVKAWLSARMHRESSFNHSGEHVMHVEACISTRKDRESHCGVSVKLVQACLSASKHRESCFNHRG